MDELRLEAQDLNQQAAMLIKAGNLEPARIKLDKAIEIDPMLMDSYKNYGDLYMAAQQYKDAKNFYKKAILVEKVPELYFLCGNACFMGDELHEGLDYYNQAITAGFDSDEMIFFMGLAYEHLNDDRMALRYFQKASAKNPYASLLGTAPDVLWGGSSLSWQHRKLLRKKESRPAHETGRLMFEIAS